jgi:hypothetical protein
MKRTIVQNMLGTAASLAPMSMVTCPTLGDGGGASKLLPMLCQGADGGVASPESRRGVEMQSLLTSSGSCRNPAA